MAIGVVPVEEGRSVNVGDEGFINETGEKVRVISVKKTAGVEIATWVTVTEKKA